MPKFTDIHVGPRLGSALAIGGEAMEKGIEVRLHYWVHCPSTGDIPLDLAFQPISGALHCNRDRQPEDDHRRTTKHTARSLSTPYGQAFVRAAMAAIELDNRKMLRDFIAAEAEAKAAAEAHRLAQTREYRISAAARPLYEALKALTIEAKQIQLSPSHEFLACMDAAAAALKLAEEGAAG